MDKKRVLKYTLCNKTTNGSTRAMYKRNKIGWSGLKTKNAFLDGTLISADGERIKVHRALFAATGDFFRVAFESSQGKDSVTLDCSGHILRLLVDFVYTEMCCLTVETAEEMLVVADMYCLASLHVHCCCVLGTFISVGTCVSIHQLALRFNAPALAVDALRYVLAHFQAVVDQCPDLYRLPASHLHGYLNHNQLNVRSEATVTQVVERWVSMDRTERAKMKPALLATARTEVRRTEADLAGVRDAGRMQPTEADVVGVGVGDADQTLMAGDEEDTVWALEGPEQAVDLDTVNKWPRFPHDVIAIIGGFCDNRMIDTFETYDPRAEAWLYWGEAVGPRAYHGLAVLDDNLYVVGGFDGASFLNCVKRMNLATLEWTDVSSLMTPRCYVSVVVLDGFIYALGGYMGHAVRLRSCERYDVKRNQWEWVPPMHNIRSDASAAVFDSQIFIAGGCDGFGPLTSVEVFDPRTQQWCLHVNLPSPRSGLQLVVAYGRIWAIGGFDGQDRLSSVLSLGASSLWWREEADLTVPRSNFGAVFFEDSIWALGGFNQERGTLAQTERWSESLGTWVPCPDMNITKSCLAAIVLTRLPDPSLFSYWHWFTLIPPTQLLLPSHPSQNLFILHDPDDLLELAIEANDDLLEFFIDAQENPLERSIED